MALLKVRRPKGLPAVVTGWERRRDNRMVISTVVSSGKVNTLDGPAVRAVIRVRGDLSVPGDVLAHVGYIKLGHMSHDVYFWGEGFFVRGVDCLGSEWQGPDKSCVLFQLTTDVPEDYMAGLELKDQ